MITILGFQIQGASVALGAVTGLVYGLLAVGLIIAYRSSGVVNFAHAQVGWFAAAVMAAAVRNWQLPYVIAVLIAVMVAAGLGAGTEAVVVRRLRKAPPLITAIATVGVAGVLAPLGALVFKQGTNTGSTYPEPPWFPKFHIGSLLVDPAQTAMLCFSPIIVLGLAYFFRRTRHGLGILGAAANPDAARTSGIPTSRLSSLAWALGGGLAAYTAVLILPSQTLVQGTFGAVLLLRALAAAVIGRMTNMPLALAGGVLIGMVESVLVWNYPQGGPTELLLFVIILVVLLVRKESRGRAADAALRGAFREVEAWEPLPESVRRQPLYKALIRGSGAVVLAAAILFGLLASNQSAFTLVVILSFSLVGLSVGIVAGLAGELTFGQFALAGVGAATAFHAAERTHNYLVGLVAAVVVASLVAMVVELPALRIRGMMLAVVTLGFATSTEFWLFNQPWMFGSQGVGPNPPAFAGIRFDTGRNYYFLTLAIFVIGFWLARNFWAGALKRRLVAIRDNDAGARAFGLRVSFLKLQAIAFAGALAGLGGAVYAFSLSLVDNGTFPAQSGIDSAAAAAVGGIGVLAGPILGVFYIIGLPSFVKLGTVAVAASALGWLGLLIQRPGGLAQVFHPLRSKLIDSLSRRRAEVTPEAGPGPGESDEAQIPEIGLQTGRTDPVGGRPSPAVRSRSGRRRRPSRILQVDGLTKQYGGVNAVSDVTFSLRAGETLGIIGANGAGKTTLFELIGGFTKANGGTVRYCGRDITHFSADARARLGMVRSFQDAALFPTLTVTETVALAHERLATSRFVAPVLGFHGRDRAKMANAADLIDLMGLGNYREKRISELSTGTRRIVDLTCILALRPQLLLLDEPSSGIAQRETEALRDVLLRVKAELDATYILIEHDMPLIMSVSDRIIAMEAGRIIAEGSPTEVKANPLVIESYLGGDIRTIERSTIAVPGVAPALTNGHHPPPKSCAAITRSGNPCRRPATTDGLCAQHAGMAVLVP